MVFGSSSVCRGPTTTPGHHHHSCGMRARLRLVGCLMIRQRSVLQLILRIFHGLFLFFRRSVFSSRSHPHTQNVSHTHTGPDVLTPHKIVIGQHVSDRSTPISVRLSNNKFRRDQHDFGSTNIHVMSDDRSH